MPKASTGKKTIYNKFIEDKTAVVGALLLLLIIITAIFAPLISPHDPQRQILRNQLRPPVWQSGSLSSYYLGTDELGRDLLSIIIYGFRISLLVGFLSAVVACLLGGILGLISGYFGGRFDSIIMRLADMQLSLPAILIALAIIAILGRGISRIILVIGIVNWAVYARTIRSTTISLLEDEFIEAAKALGASNISIIWRHIIPNSLTPLIILTAVQIPRFIMLEATLSFLGMGLPLTVPSLGLAISRGYRVLFSGYWWLSILPGVALMLIVLSINLIGDWLRDTFDPRHI